MIRPMTVQILQLENKLIDQVLILYKLCIKRLNQKDILVEKYNLQIWFKLKKKMVKNQKNQFNYYQEKKLEKANFLLKIKNHRESRADFIFFITLLSDKFQYKLTTVFNINKLMDQKQTQEMEMAMVQVAKPEINDSTSNEYKVYKRRYVMAGFFAFSTVNIFQL